MQEVWFYWQGNAYGCGSGGVSDGELGEHSC